MDHYKDIKELEKQLEITIAELDRLQNDRSLRLGLFGTRGAGKTSLWVALYLRRINSNAGINIRFDDKSLVYLKGIAEDFLQTLRTPATALEPTVIKFTLLLNGVMWNFETRDFPGEYVESSINAITPRSAKETHEFLNACDVCLCLHRWTDPAYGTLDGLDKFIRAYHFDYVFAITMLDEMGQFPDSEERLAPILQEMRKRPSFDQLCSRLEGIQNNNKRLSFIAVSPLGADYSCRTGSVSEDDIQPFNIYKPLLLAIEHKKNKLIEQEKKTEHLSKQLQDKRSEEIARLRARFRKIRQDAGASLFRFARRVIVSELLGTLSEMEERARELRDKKLAGSIRRFAKGVRITERLLLLLAPLCIVVILMTILVVLFFHILGHR